MLDSKLLSLLSTITSGPIAYASAIGGGSTSFAQRVVFANGQSFFVKQQHTPSRLFLCECEGLEAMSGHAFFSTPEVLHACEHYLILEYIETSSPSSEQFNQLGLQLAKWHQSTSGLDFGQDETNFIGPTIQAKGRDKDWGNYFCQYRLRPMIELVEAKLQKRFQYVDAFLAQTKTLLQAHAPKASLLHGDLWSGNVLFGQDRGWFLIDPAVYAGDPLVDLAMSKMFGGFPESFYQGYFSESPLSETALDQLEETYNCYHLLNHALIYGVSYFEQAQRLFAQSH